ncbi:hypothetical protein GB937_001252 [Aspergillus fischeri]|nr:hypothetical protein GB937_001252 [Aspergillus fischeri]
MDPTLSRLGFGHVKQHFVCAPANGNESIIELRSSAYGVHLDNYPWSQELPLRESLPRISELYALQVFYYSPLDLLKSVPQCKRWT